MTVKEIDMMKVGDLLEHFKQHLRITSNDLDSELTQKLLAAVSAAEHHIGKTIVTSKLTETHKFSTSFTLRAPVIELESVAVDGVTLSSDDYSLSGQVLTITGASAGSSIVLTYQSGFEAIPADMLQAIMLHAAALFNNPLDSVEALPKASSFLLRPYRSWGIIDDGE